MKRDAKYEETASGAKADRLARSIRQLITVVDDLRNRGIQFVSLRESIDTTTPGSELIFHIFGALAQFEREMIRERTKAGLEAARARGRVGGRPKVLSKKDLKAVKTMMASGKHSVSEIAERFGVNRSTLYRNIDCLIPPPVFGNALYAWAFWR